MNGLYLHIPFCHARCGYCDFVTFTGQEDKIDEYVKDLGEEIRFYPPHLNILTVFFGGGTPSVLDPRQVDQIMAAVRSHFDLDPDAEITLEANPESLSLQKARAWKASGVNRLSIGLQVFDNALLREIDRLHTVEDFMDAYRAVRQAGFDNVSIDLIFGFAGQTLKAWQKTLRSTVALAPEHLSLYALKIEEHTPFAARGLRVNDDLEADLYAWARQYLAAEGYEQYEISNFARPGKACRHNLTYWRQQDYLGIGAGAVGCVNGLRWENHKTLHAYHQDIAGGRLPRASSERLDRKTREFERLMLGLRLREGIRWDEDNKEWLAHRAMLQQKGLLEELESPGTCLPAGRRWRIPDSAVPFTNQILLPFL